MRTLHLRNVPDDVMNRLARAGEHVSLASVLDVPELLRAFVPFAHAKSGIREELTDEALTVIDEMGPGRKRS